jgi:hypothetical protein
MSRYRRAKIEGGIYFFTPALADRSSDHTLAETYDYTNWSKYSAARSDLI